MKYYKFLLFCTFWSNIGFAQTGKEASFKQTVHAVVKAFSRQDSIAINKLIHKKTGIYLLYRNGVFDNYTPLQAISFSSEGFPEIMFTNAKGIASQTLQYGKLPKYSCDKEGWNKKGLFTDTSKVDHLLSEICKARNKYVPDNIPAKTIKNYFQLELKSRRVVLVGKGDAELVFYLTYMGGKWYLTIFDQVSSDCSA